MVSKKNKNKVMTDLEKAEEYFKAGENKIHSGDYQGAIKDFDNTIKLNSDHQGAFNHRGSTYAGLGEYERAIEDYDQAITLGPQHATVYYNRGNTYAGLGEYERAIEDYDQAITLNPKDANAYNNRGLTYADLGEYERAVKDFSHIIKLNPKDVEAYNNRGNSYLKLDQDKRAIEDYDQALEHNPKHAAAYYNRGNYFAQRGKTHEAKNDFLKLIKFTKEPPNEEKYLYKYIPINSHQILSIINQELYFTPYDQLNDPLECFFINHENKDSAFGVSLKQEGIQACVLALTHQPNSKLMYSHYANAHQGLCIEYQLNFDSLKTNDLIAYGKVFYGEKSKVENLKDLYLLKNSEWNYEEEYRLVRFDNEAFFPCEIKSITFGYRCSDEYRKIIYNISQRLNIEYWELKQVGQTNNLERVKIHDLKKYQIDDNDLFKLMLKYQFENLYHYFKSQDNAKQSH